MDKQLIKTVILDKPGFHELILPLTKQGEEIEVYGLIKAEEKGEYYLKVVVDHKVGKSFGRVQIRGIAKNGASVRIEGMIKIDREANGVDDFLDMRILILDKLSSANAEPKLEIESNDVKASHAAAVSKIDDEQMFYLMSRGLIKDEAEELIVGGFLGEIEDKIKSIKK